MKILKIAALLVSQILLTYGVITTSIHTPRSRSGQIEDILGAERNRLREEEARLHSIIFRSVQHPTSVTIEIAPKSGIPKPRATEFERLSPEDRSFLNRIARAK
ncbi:MAG: hypothetical protein Q8896_08185 [Bacteroidota bacterium]|nr:hypothetical protein [Bacteroidota bacterium]MDP4235125.1 hypothetical protein [Bacteroidota bacterium]